MTIANGKRRLQAGPALLGHLKKRSLVKNFVGSLADYDTSELL